MPGLFHCLANDKQGSVATLFALALLPLIGAAAVALDYSKATRDRAELQKAVDAAALGAVDPDEIDDQRRIALAKTIFSANDRLGAQASASTTSIGERVVTVSASAKSPATLISALGISDTTVSARSCGLSGFSNREGRDSRLLLGRPLWASWIGLFSATSSGSGSRA